MCKAPVKLSQLTNQHPTYLQASGLSCRPTNSVRALKEKYHIPRICSPQAHLGVFQLCLSPLRISVTPDAISWNYELAMTSLKLIT